MLVNRLNIQLCPATFSIFASNFVNAKADLSRAKYASLHFKRVSYPRDGNRSQILRCDKLLDNLPPTYSSRISFSL